MMKQKSFFLCAFAAICAFFGSGSAWAQNATSVSTRSVELGAYKYVVPEGLPLISAQFEQRGQKISRVNGGDPDSLFGASAEMVFDDLPSPNMPALRWFVPVKEEGIARNAVAVNSSAAYVLGARNLRQLDLATGQLQQQLNVYSDYYDSRFEVRATVRGDIYLACSFIQTLIVGPIVISAIEPQDVSGIVLRITPAGNVFFAHLTAGYASLTCDALNLNGGTIVAGTIAGQFGYILKANLLSETIPWFQMFGADADSIEITRVVANRGGIVIIGNNPRGNLLTYFGEEREYLGAGAFMLGISQDGELSYVNRVVGQNARLYAGSMNREGQVVAGGQVDQDGYGFYTTTYGYGGGGFPSEGGIIRQFSLVTDSSGAYVTHRLGMRGAIKSAIIFDVDSASGNAVGAQFLGGYRQTPQVGRDFSFAGYNTANGNFTYTVWNPNKDESVPAMGRSGNHSLIAAFDFTTVLNIFGLRFSAGFGQPGHFVACFDISSVQWKKFAVTTGVEDKESGADGLMPSDFELRQNYPNPFNPTTKIAYNVPTGKTGSISIYSVTGQLVYEVTELRGTGEIEWRAVNQQGMPVSSGIYVYRLEVGNESISRRMNLLQ